MSDAFAWLDEPNNLVQRLRRAYGMTQGAPSILIEAADELERALALLRELNDALLPIPDALQERLDAILDVSDAAHSSSSKEK